MQPVPYFDQIQTVSDLSQSELKILVAFMYVSSFCFICELIMALTNTWMFLIKQRKYKTWPLLMFYILTIWLAGMRLITSILYFRTIVEQDLFGFTLNPILKLNIGLVQCWMLFELGLQVTLSIKMTEYLQKNVHSEE